MTTRKGYARIAALLLAALMLIAAATVAGADEFPYAEQIDKTTIMTVSIEADPEAWQSLLNNATDKEYISANITINGQTVENVGIRAKGNSSLSTVARSDSDRYSFKIKFDEYVKNQTWLGLDKIVLNSNYSDASSMKEYISYDIMQYIGVNAPLFAYADITVNGESWGFYLAVEDLDGSFKDRVYGKGELYKPDNEMGLGGEDFMQGGQLPEGFEMPEGFDPFSGEGMPQMPEGFDPSTFEGAMPQMPGGDTDASGEAGTNFTPPDVGAAQDSTAAPDASGGTGSSATMPDFGNMPGGAGGRRDFGGQDMGERGGGGMGGMAGMDSDGVSLQYTDDDPASYSAIFDNDKTKTDEADHLRVIEALKNLSEGTDLETYVDVDAVLRYFAAHTVVVNLDSYVSNMGHNYVLYENGESQISMLPWDYNMAFGGFMSGNASDVVNFPIDTPVSGVSMEDRPLLAKLLEVPEYLERYHQYLQEIIDGYFADGQFEQTVSAIDAMIASYIEDDPSAFYTYEQYQAAVAELKTLGTLRGQSIQGQLDGTIPATTEGQAANPDALVDASTLNMNALGGQSGMGGMGGDTKRGNP